MKAELQEKLFKKYPKFFEHLKGYEGPILPIQFGIECGDGWYVLIDSLMDCIHSYIENKEKYPDTQIKSKFWRTVLPKLKYNFRNSRWTWRTLHRFEKSLKEENIPAPIVQLDQVKEKFGGLRFYITGGNEYIDGMIRFAEEMSYKTCELCGSTEKIGYTRGWIITVCKKCFDEGKTNMKTWDPIEE